MRVLYIHQYFNTPSMNGSTRSYEFARRLIQARHEVHMITSNRESGKIDKPYEENIEGIHVYWQRIPYSNSFSYIRRIWSFIKYVVKTTYLIMKIKCDVVFATSTPLTVALPAIIYSKVKHVPMVFEVRDLWPELPIAIGAIKSKIIIKLAKILEKTAYYNSKYVIALSPGIKEGICKTGYPRTKVKVIFNLCDIERFKVSKSEGKFFFDEYKFIGNRKLIVYTGTFGVLNGVSYLVFIAKEMTKLNKNVVFVAIGDGREKKKNL